MNLSLLCLLFALNSLVNGKPSIVKLSGSGPVDWGYLKNILPSSWGGSYSDCNGVRQSPIDIPSRRAVYDNGLKDILIRRRDVDAGDETWEVQRASYGINFEPINKEFSFIMTPDYQRYVMLQMYFHWRGSEHTIDGKKFSAELHLVHQSESDPSKLAVLGFLFTLSDKNNTRLNNIIASLRDVREADADDYETTTIKLNEIIPTRFKKYYRYPGSLTTPECAEIVEWFVVQDPILTISEEQLIDLQRIEDEDGFLVLTNSRPVQPLNGRVVRKSFHDYGYQSYSKNYPNSQKNYPSIPYQPSLYPSLYADSYINPQLYLYPEPSYRQSSYSEPSFRQSSYSEPSYRQSSYSEPSFTKSSYSDPSNTTASYT